ncbi:hypothetical protein BV22DRAFT_990972, partial [Leucogyrophana mollusca]
WMLARQLRDVLKILKDATLFFSQTTLNLAMVIPAMDLIDETFTNGILNQNNSKKCKTVSPAIRAAIGLAKKMLNWYYTLADTSEVYRIAIVLHPRHKLEYFRIAGWMLEWINT